MTDPAGVSDDYISALHLSEKFPEIFGKSVPSLKEVVKSPALKITFNSSTRDHEQRLSRFGVGGSHFNSKKRAFSETGKGLKPDSQIMQDLRLDENFNIPRKGMIPVQRIFNRLRRKKFYRSIDKLTNDHYFMIGDLAAHSLYEGSPIKQANNRKRLKVFWGTFSTILANKLKAEALLNRVALFIKYADEKIPTFNTNTYLGIAWNLIVLSLCVAQIFIYSVEKCFGTQLKTNNLVYATVLIIWLDLFVKLNTRFYVEGVQIVDRRKIFKYIARNNLFTEIIPCFCLTPLLFSNSSRDIYDVNLIILLKIWSALEIGEKIGDLLIKGDISQSIYDMVVLILTILLSAHLIACLWHYIGYYSNVNNPEGMNWLKLKRLTDESWSVRYLFSVYWGVTTMLTVGYGDISPSNETEIFFNIWAMVLGCGMFGYSMNRIGEILRFAGENKRRQRKRMKKAIKMMREKEVPPETQLKVRKYLEFVWKQENQDDPQHEKEIIGKLNSKLRDEILLSTNVTFLKKVEAFKLFSDKTLLYLANFMRKVHFSPEEMVYKEKDNEDTSVYFVIDGALESVFWTDKTTPSSNSIKTVYRKYDYFGVQEIFSGRSRVSGVVSLDFSTVFKLSRNDILYVLQKCPEDYERFCKLRDMDIVYDNQSFYNIKCESCGFEDHRINECKFLRYLPSRLQLISRYINRKNKVRRKFKRKHQNKQNCLIEKDRNREFLEEFIQNYKSDPDIIQLNKCYDRTNSDVELDENKIGQSSKLLDGDSQDNFDEKSEDKSENSMHLSLDRFATQKTSKTRTISSQRFKTKSSNSFHSIFGPKSAEKSPTLSIFDKSKKSHEFKTLSSNHTTRTKLMELVFDRIKIYKHYFPWNNADIVAKKCNTLKKRYNSSPKNYTVFS